MHDRDDTGLGGYGWEADARRELGDHRAPRDHWEEDDGWEDGEWASDDDGDPAGALIDITPAPVGVPPVLTLSPHGLGSLDLPDWYEDLWDEVCMLQRRYRLPVRTLWWEEGVVLEALAALAVWVQRYDLGEWDDPPGKLALLFDLQRVDAILRDGNDPFDPVRDRPAFDAHVDGLVPA